MTKLCKDGSIDMRQFNTGRPKNGSTGGTKKGGSKKGGCFKRILYLLIIVAIALAVYFFVIK